MATIEQFEQAHRDAIDAILGHLSACRDERCAEWPVDMCGAARELRAHTGARYDDWQYALRSEMLAS